MIVSILRIRGWLFMALMFSASMVFSQGYPGRPQGGGGQQGKDMNIGRFYGKVVDESGKGIGYANVQLIQAAESGEKVISGQLTASNGDFSLEKLPVRGPFTLRISYIGYASVSQEVSFGKPGGGFPAGGFEKDLGNIKLAASDVTMDTVTVTAEVPVATLALDKKIYRVDKDVSAIGGNAQDALRNVPSLSVDIDGNVKMRNGSPQIFIDGRPTTLTLDQLAADDIETVEVITNPSAKYDAGGGTAGIINIVLKKDRRLGYNGNIRAGVDTRGGYNAGGSLNARGEKINLFASGNFNRRNGYSEGETFRQNLFGSPMINLTQLSDGTQGGIFANGRAGVDWFMDNRNTLTFSGSYTRGKFGSDDDLMNQTDFLYPDSTVSESYNRNSIQDRNFQNIGGSVLFKHLFPKEGAEWTADVSYNRVKFWGNSDYTTIFEDGSEGLEKQNALGQGQFMTVQTDFVNPLNEKMTLEGGLRAALRRNQNSIENSFRDMNEGIWVPVNNLADNYQFDDNVYAAYGQFKHQLGSWGYQVGLRVESSNYTGTLPDVDSAFTIAYPLSLFPSLFLTKKLNETDNVQFAYTRRINRPNFFQTMPFIDFSDSLNLRRGNPLLLPEFMNSAEISYQKIFSKGHNILVSAYFKQATDMITTYLVSEYVEEFGREVLISTYNNSNNSMAYGAEFTMKNTLIKSVDLTSNLNVYQSRVDASNVEKGLIVNQLSWFLKENLQIGLPAEFMLQISGEYRSRAAFTPNSGNRMPWMQTSTNTAQGYSLANWFVDVSVRKNFLNRKASLSLSVNDIFRTRKFGTYSESNLFIQDTYRVSNAQIFRLNFSYSFGKRDMSLFKRKNMKMNDQGMDMM